MPQSVPRMGKLCVPTLATSTCGLYAPIMVIQSSSVLILTINYIVRAFSSSLSLHGNKLTEFLGGETGGGVLSKRGRLVICIQTVKVLFYELTTQTRWQLPS